VIPVMTKFSLFLPFFFFILLTSGAFAVVIDDFEDGEPKNYSFC